MTKQSTAGHTAGPTPALWAGPFDAAEAIEKARSLFDIYGEREAINRCRVQIREGRSIPKSFWHSVIHHIETLARAAIAAAKGSAA